MTVYKEVGVNVEWNDIVEKVLSLYGILYVKPIHINEVAEKMQKIEFEFIELE